MKKMLGLLILSLTLASHVEAADLPIKFTLDWKIQGIHSWFYLAKERGYFAKEGLDVQIDQGEGSAATVTRIMSGAYDAGFGDMAAVVQNRLAGRDETPVMVYQLYNQPPFSVLVKSDGPVTDLKKLEGLKVAGPAGAAATRLFPALAASAGFDLQKVEIINVAPAIQEQMLIRGNVDASLVFNVTSYLNLVGLGLDPDKDFRWINYGDHGVDIYSNGVMVSRKLLKDHPKAVRGLVKAINHAVMDVLHDPKLGAATIKATEPLINDSLEQRRIDFAIKNLIVSDATRKVGIGGVSDDRLHQTIDIVKKTYELTGNVTPAQVFDAQFLPPLSERLVN